ncbi:Outer membrane efflux protein BepC [bacterium HR40]|nr:Outer membrane efflux protein BepC [bacterium HR40]
MRRITTALVVGAVLGSGLAAPLAAESVGDLRQALERTYRDNPELDAARARLRAVDENVPQALAGFRPRISVDGSGEAVAGQTDLGDLDRRGGSLALTLRQNLYAGGATTAAVERAEQQVLAERGRLAASEQQVLLAAVEAYSATWRDRAVLEFARNNRDRIARQLQATRDRFAVGEVSRTDVAQAEARLARAQADIESALAGLAASTAEFRRVVGADPAASLADPESYPNLPQTLEEALARAANHPSVVAARFDLAAAQAAVREAEAGLRPSVDVVADAGYAREPTVSVDWQRRAAVGLQVTVPLYQGGADYSRVRQARQTVTQRQRDLDATTREVQRQVAAAWEALRAAGAAMTAFEAQVRASSIALEGVRQEALVGTRTVLDVLDAEQELFDSQVSLVRARSDRVVASYRLAAALGELGAANLGLAVELYDPASHYERQRTRLFGTE